jgi:hypothetical protein
LAREGDAAVTNPKQPPTPAEQMDAILSRVAASPARQGTASGGPHLPPSGAVLDIDIPDFNEMREQINAVHQGPAWYRVQTLHYIICRSYAVAVCDAGVVTMVVALNAADDPIAVMLPCSLSSLFAEDIYRLTHRQINKQKQCAADCIKYDRGCKCEQGSY